MSGDVEHQGNRKPGEKDTGMRIVSFRVWQAIRLPLFVALAALLVIAPAAAQKDRRLSEKEVLELLNGGVPSERVAELVKEKGISFEPNAEIERRLRAAGATQELIGALRRFSRRKDQTEKPRVGSLKIETKPGEAQVYMNDEFKGMTSPEGVLMLPGLSPGTYRLRVSLAGYESWENPFAVNPGESQTVFVTLNAKTPLPSLNLVADRTTIESGQAVTLTWVSENASDLELSPSIGKVQAKGSTRVTPRDSTTYTLSARGPGGTNTATVQVSVTTPQLPVVQTTPGGMGNLPIPGARITEVRLFEGSDEVVAYEKRAYKTKFDRASTRYIWWELNLAYPKLASKIEFDVDAVFYNPDGSVLGRSTKHAHADPEWTESWHTDGYGWKDPGRWSPGQYRLDLVVNGSKIGGGSFEITGGTEGIPIPGARITELRIYEGGYDVTPYEKRVYRDRFDRTSTRYLWWELNLAYPKLTSKIEFDIDAVYYNSDGSVFARQTKNAHVDAEWTESWHTFGHGWKDAGHWTPGKYRLDLYVKGNKVASRSFEIY